MVGRDAGAPGGDPGRHESVDLAVGADATLSLRHLLVVVRLVAGVVRYSVLDLETPGGLHSRHGAQPLTEARGPVLLRAGQLTFCCAPTGPSCALAEDEQAAWSRDPAPARRSLMDALLNRPVGVLTLHLGEHRLPLSVDDEMLCKGVLLGRHTRCEVIIPDQQVSRVHAVVLKLDGAPYVLDAGSSNHTWHPSGPVKCRRLEDGDVYFLGQAVVSWRSRA